MIKDIKHVNPVSSGIGMQKVYKSSRAWPDLSMILIAFCSFDEHISESAFIVSSAVVDLDASVDNWNVPIFFKNLTHLVEWESFFVDGEIFVVDHVVDVGPDGVKRDVVGFVVFDNILQH